MFSAYSVWKKWPGSFDIDILRIEVDRVLEVGYRSSRLRSL